MQEIPKEATASDERPLPLNWSEGMPLVSEKDAREAINEGEEELEANLRFK